MTRTEERRTDSDESRPIRIETPSRGVLGSALQVVVLLLLLSVLAAVMLLLFAVASLVNVPGQVGGGVGAGLAGVASQASRAVTGAQQALQSATDPNHPPTGLVYDNEFNALSIWRAGDQLPGGTQYAVTLQGIKRREGAESPDTSQYAVVHAELRQPRETRLFGQLLRSDSDPHDYVLYKGETFRLGRALYRVNWVSQDEGALAAATYRNPDGVSAPLKFDYP
jgi:hypothetical protein